MTSQQRRVFIVLGLYRPDPELLSRQLASLASQTHRNIEILVSSDGPLDLASQSVIDGFSGPSLRCVGFDTRVGVHANFARGLRKAVAASRSDTDLFAFCDQDDVWYPTKLETQIACFDDTRISLCHSDARIVSQQGELLVTSLFQHEARLRMASFIDLLIMNSVTGMTAIFRRDVAVAAEPFPLSGCRYILHDHWAALVASLLGSICFIDEPLVDYTQHAGNVVGAKPWQGARRGMLPSPRRTYLRKCYRQFAWRRRALNELRKGLGSIPGVADRLRAMPVSALFDCGSTQLAALRLLPAYWLRGQRRQADQVWRIWRGKSLYCSSKEQP